MYFAATRARSILYALGRKMPSNSDVELLAKQLQEVYKEGRESIRQELRELLNVAEKDG